MEAQLGEGSSGRPDPVQLGEETPRSSGRSQTGQLVLNMGVSWSSRIQRPWALRLESQKGHLIWFSSGQQRLTPKMWSIYYLILPSAQALVGKAESDSSSGLDSIELFSVGKCTPVP